MANIIPATLSVQGREKAVSLKELHEQSPFSRGFHRYQIIRVIRDGRIAEYREDMGLAKNFKGVNQFQIPSLMEHTVDELKDLADSIRGEVQIDVKELTGLDRYKPA